MNFSFYQFDKETQKELQEKGNLLLFLGISSCIIGALAIYFALFSSIITIFYFGVLLLIFSILEGIKIINFRTIKSFIIHLFLTVFYGVTGMIILAHPLLSELTLTLVLAYFFIASGLLKIFFALVHTLDHTGLQIVQGTLSTILGILIWHQWPISGLWVMGTYIGIDIFISGLIIITLWYCTRKDTAIN